MLIESEPMNIKEGETIRFNITNKGELEHEFVLDTVERNAEHKIEMAKMDMEHDDPNRIRLDAGASGEVVWTFANSGTFEAACLIPGHYESGMHREVAVGDQMAQADVEYTSGTIKKIDAKAGKVTIIHGPLVNLDMPAMTMVFRADEAMMAKMAEGQGIEFVADRVKGKLTVTQMK
jgi:Cu/Ag efflux protein CusF